MKSRLLVVANLVSWLVLWQTLGVVSQTWRFRSLLWCGILFILLLWRHFSGTHLMRFFLDPIWSPPGCAMFTPICRKTSKTNFWVICVDLNLTPLPPFSLFPGENWNQTPIFFNQCLVRECWSFAWSVHSIDTEPWNVVIVVVRVYFAFQGTFVDSVKPECFQKFFCKNACEVVRHFSPQPELCLLMEKFEPEVFEDSYLKIFFGRCCIILTQETVE